MKRGGGGNTRFLYGNGTRRTENHEELGPVHEFTYTNVHPHEIEDW